jgi:hypothetical protein
LQYPPPLVVAHQGKLVVMVELPLSLMEMPAKSYCKHLEAAQVRAVAIITPTVAVEAGLAPSVLLAMRARVEGIQRYRVRLLEIV